MPTVWDITNEPEDRQRKWLAALSGDKQWLESEGLMCLRCEKMFPPDRTFHCSDCGLLVCGDCSQWILPEGAKTLEDGKIRVCFVCIEQDLRELEEEHERF